MRPTCSTPPPSSGWPATSRGCSTPSWQIRSAASRSCRCFGAAERRQLAAWTGTVAPYTEDRCLHELFAAQAARTPDAPAVICEDRTLSYGELDRRANRLAHHLRALGVGPDIVVGLSMTRSPEMVVGVLGNPQGRRRLPAARSRLSARTVSLHAGRCPRAGLLTQGILAGIGCGPCRHPGAAHADAPQHIARWPDTPPPDSTVAPDNLAYVIYTSGSTGRPKA